MPNGNENGTGGTGIAMVIMSGLVAISFVALVGFIFWRATDSQQNFDQIWGAAGPIIGVVVGAIPSFFFHRQARAERARSAVLADRNTMLAAIAKPEDARAVMGMTLPAP
jgi:uncharacterized membrane protein YdjX (TVP38/TMEM64 family)